MLRTIGPVLKTLSIVGMLLACLLTASPTQLQAEEGVWVAVGYGGRRMVSKDGLHWEITAEWAQPGGDDSNNLMSLVFAQGKFVATGGGGGGKTGGGHILVSKDGREWKEVHAAANRINPIIYGNNRFVAGGPGRALLWSADGETWQAGAKIAAKEATHFRQGAFGNGIYLFVGNHGGNGGPHWAAVSPDGEKITHEAVDLPGHGKLVFGSGTFLMLSSHHDADLLATTDGITWKTIVVDGDVKLDWLVRAGDRFLAGDGKTVYASTDGQAWEATKLTSKGNLIWSDGTRSIATSWPGKMFYSADTINWQDSPPLTANGINRVVYGE